MINAVERNNDFDFDFGIAPREIRVSSRLNRKPLEHSTPEHSDAQAFNK
jgi:hypothetical protein